VNSDRSPVPQTVRLRLTGMQVDYLRPGLLREVIACFRIRDGESPSAEMPVVFDPSLPCGSYDRVLANRIIQLWATAYPHFGSKRRARIALDFVQLSACALAVRTNARQLRHGHITLPGVRHTLVRSRLLRLLENSRRRATRAAEKAIGLEAVAEIQRRWHGFARWLSFYATSCRCGKSLIPGQRYQWRRFVIDTAVEIARKELTAIGLEPPQARDLRRLVRLAISSVRRGRAGWGIRTLITRPEGGSYLLHFILKRTLTPLGE